MYALRLSIYQIIENVSLSKKRKENYSLLILDLYEFETHGVDRRRVQSRDPYPNHRKHLPAKCTWNSISISSNEELRKPEF